jgi:hypothetical protein
VATAVTPGQDVDPVERLSFPSAISIKRAAGPLSGAPHCRRHRRAPAAGQPHTRRCSGALGAEQIIKAVRQRWPFLKHLFADGAYDRAG